MVLTFDVGAERLMGEHSYSATSPLPFTLLPNIASLYTPVISLISERNDYLYTGDYTVSLFFFVKFWNDQVQQGGSTGKLRIF